jgi:hypothetical protein
MTEEGPKNNTMAGYASKDRRDHSAQPLYLRNEETQP